MRIAIFLILSVVACGGPNVGIPRAESDPAVFQAGASNPQPEPPIKFECNNISGTLGAANINFDASTVIRFYKEPSHSQPPPQILRFFEDTSLKMISFRGEGEKSYLELNPDRHKLDYFLFDLSVRSRRGGWLEVAVGEQANETLWLQESKHVRFKDWLKQMKDSFSVGRRDAKSNPLRITSDENSSEVEFTGKDCFKVEEMKGGWVKVTQQNHCSDNPNQPVSGWIRWKDDNECLLVEIFPFA